MTSPDPVLPQDSGMRRPAVHLTARETWMNDPNGLVRHGGLWHAFFQNNPFGSDWGHMSWGHATSEDLLHWREHPVAIAEEDEIAIFSGSVVEDADDTLVALYTGASSDSHPEHPRIQAQHLARSRDGGFTWEKRAGGPVLTRGTTDFRDPKVFRDTVRERWVMVAVEAEDREMLIHTSPDLLAWEHVSTFRHDAVEGIYECPDLVPLRAEDPGGPWLLILSSNPGGIAGGSGCHGLLGTFDGRSFQPRSGAAGDPFPLDHGPDFYAAVSFSGIDSLADRSWASAPLVLGWASNWEYAGRSPSAPWRGAMALPRQLVLRPGSDASTSPEPVDAAIPVLSQPVLPSEPLMIHLAEGANLDPTGVHVLQLPLPPLGGAIELASPERTELRWERSDEGLRVVRAEAASPAPAAAEPASGEGVFAPLLASAPIPVGPEDRELVLILDGSIAETVLVTGAAGVQGPMATLLFDPAPGSWTLRQA